VRFVTEWLQGFYSGIGHIYPRAKFTKARKNRKFLIFSLIVHKYIPENFRAGLSALFTPNHSQINFGILLKKIDMTV
jgi:hypothetical protein